MLASNLYLHERSPSFWLPIMAQKIARRDSCKRDGQDLGRQKRVRRYILSTRGSLAFQACGDTDFPDLTGAPVHFTILPYLLRADAGAIRSGAGAGDPASALSLCQTDECARGVKVHDQAHRGRN
jgi:hypothetical protein